ncbi:DUF2809 domain-containing protein, partial [Pseudomonas aeruginosa]
MRSTGLENCQCSCIARYWPSSSSAPTAKAAVATLGRHWGWVRGFGGDLLAVAWLYYLLNGALRAPAGRLATAAFAVGALLELGQYLAMQLHWQF